MQLRRLPFSALRAFEAAARHTSFAAAARELGVTPAAVSHQIRALEARIGRQLFTRRNRSLSLSQSGVKLSQPLTDLFAQMAAVFAEVSAHGVQSFEVTAMPSFATKWLAPRLAQFSVVHPDCRVRLVASDELVDFKNGKADVGVRYGAGGYRELRAERLMRVVAYPVCSEEFARRHTGHLKSPADLRHLPLLHDESSLIAPGLPSWKTWFEAAGIRRTAVQQGMIFDSAYLAIEAALAGQGIALGLSPLVSDDIKAKRLVRLLDIGLPSAYSFWFVCRRDRFKDPRVAQFRDWIMAEVEAMTSSGSADDDRSLALASQQI